MPSLTSSFKPNLGTIRAPGASLSGQIGMMGIGGGNGISVPSVPSVGAPNLGSVGGPSLLDASLQGEQDTLQQPTPTPAGAPPAAAAKPASISSVVGNPITMKKDANGKTDWLSVLGQLGAFGAMMYGAKKGNVAMAAAGSGFLQGAAQERLRKLAFSEREQERLEKEMEREAEERKRQEDKDLQTRQYYQSQMRNAKTIDEVESLLTEATTSGVFDDKQIKMLDSSAQGRIAEIEKQQIKIDYARALEVAQDDPVAMQELKMKYAQYPFMADDITALGGRISVVSQKMSDKKAEEERTEYRRLLGLAATADSVAVLNAVRKDVTSLAPEHQSMILDVVKGRTPEVAAKEADMKAKDRAQKTATSLALADEAIKKEMWGAAAGYWNEAFPDGRFSGEDVKAHVNGKLTRQRWDEIQESLVKGMAQESGADKTPAESFLQRLSASGLGEPGALEKRAQSQKAQDEEMRKMVDHLVADFANPKFDEGDAKAMLELQKQQRPYLTDALIQQIIQEAKARAQQEKGTGVLKPATGAQPPSAATTQQDTTRQPRQSSGSGYDRMKALLR